jgi:hypothetical protein
MKKIGEFETIDEYYRDIRYGVAYDLIATRAGEGGFNHAFRVNRNNGDLIAELRVRFSEPINLRISRRIDQAHGNAVSLLHFEEQKIPEGIVRRIGNLTISGYPAVTKSGLRIIDIIDMPEEQQDAIDTGVKLLASTVEEFIPIRRRA